MTSADQRSSFVCSWAFAACLALVALAGQPASARAEAPAAAQVAVLSLPQKPLLLGNFLSILGNRSRMIQVGLVAVALGIFILVRK